MSDSSSVAVTLKKETTYGTNPGGSGGTTLRLTGESLKQVNETTRSEEIRSDRQSPDIIRRSIGASGQIRGEFSHTTYDDLLASSLLDSAWSSPVTHSAVNLAITAATGTITRASGDFTADGFLVGRWVKLAGFSNAGNNCIGKLITVGTTTMTIATYSTLVDEGSAAARTVTMGGEIVNGTTLDSYTIVRNYTDLSNKMEQFTGMCFDKFGLVIPTSDKFGVTFDFLGKRALSVSSAGFTSNAASTTPIMESIDHVLAVYEGTLAAGPSQAGLAVVDASMELANNLRQRLQVGTLGAISIGKGQCEVRGSVRSYFTSETEFDKFLGHTASGLSILTQDGSATPKQYVFDLPRLRFVDGERVAGGINQDVIGRLDFEAYMHETQGVTFRIVRFP